MMAVVLALVTAACGGGGSNVYEIVVPLGTGELLAQGETVDVMPAEIRLEVGDTLKIRNEDVVDQEVGPYLVAAGTQFVVQFGAPGLYEGICPLSGSQGYKIVITE